jgi:hypothetical protein
MNVSGDSIGCLRFEYSPTRKMDFGDTTLAMEIDNGRMAGVLPRRLLPVKNKVSVNRSVPHTVLVIRDEKFKTPNNPKPNLNHIIKTGKRGPIWIVVRQKK